MSKNEENPSGFVLEINYMPEDEIEFIAQLQTMDAERGDHVSQTVYDCAKNKNWHRNVPEGLRPPEYRDPEVKFSEILEDQVDQEANTQMLLAEVGDTSLRVVSTTRED